MTIKMEIKASLCGVLIKNCPVVSHHSPGGELDCFFFGHTGTCESCTYNWPMIVGKILSEAGIKKLSSEKSESEFDEIKQRLSASMDFNKRILRNAANFGIGVRAMMNISEMMSDTCSAIASLSDANRTEEAVDMVLEKIIMVGSSADDDQGSVVKDEGQEHGKKNL